MGKFNQMSVELSSINTYVSPETMLKTKKSNPIHLRAVYCTSSQDYIYTIDDNNVIRRMKIDSNGDRTLARIVYAKAKSLVNKKVVFLTTDTIDKRGKHQEWDNNVWFCDVEEAV